jgi:quercetin dioxygenase-like cupin family protein
MKIHRWRSIPAEQLNANVTRQAIHAANMTVARIHLLQGARVPEHRHPSEQITFLQQGRLRFTLDAEVCVLEAGEMLEIPPNVPHSVEAVEESVAVDVFAPVREDWIRGDDAYLRK